MKNQPQIPEMYGVKYHHDRDEETGRLLGTVCIISVKGDRGWTPVAEGRAYVSDREASPSKELGRTIAAGRALKSLKQTVRSMI